MSDIGYQGIMLAALSRNCMLRVAVSVTPRIMWQYFMLCWIRYDIFSSNSIHPGFATTGKGSYLLPDSKSEHV